MVTPLPASQKGNHLKVQQSETKQIGSGFEQEIRYQDGLKSRREIFVGRSRKEAIRMTAERVRELSRSLVGGIVESSNFDIGMIRKQALDNSAPTGRRLAAIDRLASLSNVYQSPLWHQSRFVETGSRARRFVVYALRRLLKVESTNQKLGALIRDRLIFIRTGEQVGSNSKVMVNRDRLWRLEGSGVESEKPAPTVTDTSSFDEALRRVEEENKHLEECNAQI